MLTEYKILDGERNIGRLRVFQNGLMTVFEARTERREGLCRLWLIGRDKTAYLGIAAPDGDGNALKKSFSRRALLELPCELLYASVKDAPPPAKPQPESGGGWRMGRMGVLTRIRDGIIETAIPSELPDDCRGIKEYVIGGKKYIIFLRPLVDRRKEVYYNR